MTKYLLLFIRVSEVCTVLLLVKALLYFSVVNMVLFIKERIHIIDDEVL